jgi:hypothetical protein
VGCHVSEILRAGDEEAPRILVDGCLRCYDLALSVASLCRIVAGLTGDGKCGPLAGTTALTGGTLATQARLVQVGRRYEAASGEPG